MSPNVRNIFIIAGLLAAYGAIIWLAEKQGMLKWADDYEASPGALFARDHDRDNRIAEEGLVPSPPEASDAAS